jgi:MFS family permease
MNFSPAKSERPTRVRYGVLAFACTLSMITYLDRVCISSAAPHFVEEFGLQSIADMNVALGAFVFAYAIFEVPTGWLGDVFGPRRTLIRIVAWWSVFTALTGLVSRSGFLFVGGLGLLGIVRFLFGMGEAGAYPNITRALHNWFPRTERGFSQGMVWMCGRMMGGLSPLIWMLLVERGGLPWRSAFWIFGAVGVLWCLAFAGFFRNRPEQHPSVNEAERALISFGDEQQAAHAGVPWHRFLKSTNLWALCCMYFCGAFGWYFNINYLPTFLEEEFGVNKGEWTGSLYKGGPLLMGAVACLAGGWLSDRFIKRTGNRRWGRRLFGLVGHGLCGVCYAMCLVAPTAFTFSLAISLAAFWNDLTMGAAWATCQDIGRRYAAIVAGCMNTIGNLGGAVAVYLTGPILRNALDSYANAHQLNVAALSASEKAAALLPGYHINFMLYSAVYGIAVLLWLRIDATQPVVPDEDDGHVKPVS